MTDNAADSDHPKSPLARDLGLIFKAIFAFDPPRVFRTLGLVFVASLIEGLGLFLIFPLAGLIFEDVGVRHPALSFVNDTLESFGLTSVSSKLWLFSGVYLTLVLLRAGVLSLREAVMNDLKNDFVNHERITLYRKVSNTSWPVISQLDRSGLLNTLTGNLVRIGNCLHFLMNGTVQTVQLIVLAMTALFIAPILTIAIVLMGGLATLTTGKFLRKSHLMGARATIIGRNMLHETSIFLSGLKAAKIYGAEDAFIERFRENIEEARANSREFTLQQSKLRRFLEITASVIVIFVFVGGYTYLNISGPALVAMAAVLLRMVPTTISLAQGAQQIVNAAPAYAESQRAAQTLRAEAIRPDSGIDKKTIAEALNQYGLQLRNIRADVRTETEKSTLLEIDDLTLPGHGLVMVVGPSGAGKSTFAEVLTGLRRSPRDEIKLGPVELNEQSMAAWQKQVSFLPQEHFLFSGTVKTNLMWPDGQLSEDQIFSGLRDAQAENLVASLPNGLEQKLLDGGIRLSGGERQRICLARALARPAIFYVLDEPTANLDRQTELDVIRALKIRAQSVLIILISHNPDLQAYADLIIQISDGRLKSVKPQTSAVPC